MSTSHFRLGDKYRKCLSREVGDRRGSQCVLKLLGCYFKIFSNQRFLLSRPPSFGTLPLALEQMPCTLPHFVHVRSSFASSLASLAAGVLRTPRTLDLPLRARHRAAMSTTREARSLRGRGACQHVGKQGNRHRVWLLEASRELGFDNNYL